MSISRRFVHRNIHPILLLITGFCTHPSDHGITLRTQKSSRICRKIKTRRFSFHHTTSCLLSGNYISESDIVITHPENDIYLLLISIRKSTNQLIRLIVYLWFLDLVLSICFIDPTCLLPNPIHIPAKIPDIGHHPQRGIFQNCLFFVSDRINRFSLLQGHIHFQMRVRSNYLSLLSPYRNGNPHQQAVFQIFFHVFKIIYMQDKDNISAIQNKD